MKILSSTIIDKCKNIQKFKIFIQIFCEPCVTFFVYALTFSESSETMLTIYSGLFIWHVWRTTFLLHLIQSSLSLTYTHAQVRTQQHTLRLAQPDTSGKPLGVLHMPQALRLPINQWTVFPSSPSSSPSPPWSAHPLRSSVCRGETAETNRFVFRETEYQ